MKKLRKLLGIMVLFSLCIAMIPTQTVSAEEEYPFIPLPQAECNTVITKVEWDSRAEMFVIEYENGLYEYQSLSEDWETGEQYISSALYGQLYDGMVDAYEYSLDEQPTTMIKAGDVHNGVIDVTAISEKELLNDFLGSWDYGYKVIEENHVYLFDLYAYIEHEADWTYVDSTIAEGISANAVDEYFLKLNGTRPTGKIKVLNFASEEATYKLYKAYNGRLGNDQDLVVEVALQDGSVMKFILGVKDALPTEEAPKLIPVPCAKDCSAAITEVIVENEQEVTIKYADGTCETHYLEWDFYYGNYGVTCYVYKEGEQRAYGYYSYDVGEMGDAMPVVGDIPFPATEEPVEEPKEDVTTEEPVEEPKEDVTTEEPAEEPKEDVTTEEPVEEPKEDVTTEEPVEEPKEDVTAEEPVEEPKEDTTTETAEETEDNKEVIEKTKDGREVYTGETVYIVKKGDCLWTIAKQLLGNGAKYTELFTRNNGIIEKATLIFPGQEIIVPAK